MVDVRVDGDVGWWWGVGCESLRARRRRRKGTRLCGVPSALPLEADGRVTMNGSSVAATVLDGRMATRSATARYSRQLGASR